jgi:hypothetical protein
MCPATNDYVEQGLLLRKALIEHVRLAKETGQFQRSGLHNFIEVGEIFKQYVPEGCTFDYAENVLRSAGFTFDHRPTPDSPNSLGGEYAFDVNAFLGYGGESFEGVQCVVALRPAGPYDYGPVHRVITTCGYI